MKRLIAFIGVVLVLVGIRFFDSGLFRISGGHLTVYKETEYTPQIFLPTGADSYRIDLPKNTDIDALLNECDAKIVFTEDKGRIIYAYSPIIARSEWVHGKRVNIMVYVGKTSINIGVPILKGSY